MLELFVPWLEWLRGYSSWLHRYSIRSLSLTGTRVLGEKDERWDSYWLVSIRCPGIYSNRNLSTTLFLGKPKESIGRSFSPVLETHGKIGYRRVNWQSGDANAFCLSPCTIVT